MEPNLSLALHNGQRDYQPGESLGGSYQVEAASADDVTAIEISVLWYTEGKGDEDLSVHFFQRRVPSESPERDLRGGYSFETTLPNSPLSYSGVSLRIRWSVRLRVFLQRGREMSLQVPIQLGQTHSARRVEIPRSVGPSSSDAPGSAGSAGAATEGTRRTPVTDSF
ncbi:MAG: hypothetical protein FJ295_02830 [Planctomycetes bacterium]|nr:hypothetical protein [Planctomycetota bacterium]